MQSLKKLFSLHAKIFHLTKYLHEIGKGYYLRNNTISEEIVQIG